MLCDLNSEIIATDCHRRNLHTSAAGMHGISSSDYICTYLHGGNLWESSQFLQVLSEMEDAESSGGNDQADQEKQEINTLIIENE